MANFHGHKWDNNKYGFPKALIKRETRQTAASVMAGQKDSQSKVKINKWDGSACKNAIDDEVKDVLVTRFNYSESFHLMDYRLLICGIAVGVAAFALLWDHLYPFPLSRPILITCVSTYFVLMGVLTLYTTYKEKGIFVVTTQKEGRGKGVWEASSYMPKFDDKYHLTLSHKDGKSGVKNESSVTRSVANFIDENGVIVPEMVEAEVVRLHNSLLSEKKDK